MLSQTACARFQRLLDMFELGEAESLKLDMNVSNCIISGSAALYVFHPDAFVPGDIAGRGVLGLLESPDLGRQTRQTHLLSHRPSLHLSLRRKSKEGPPKGFQVQQTCVSVGVRLIRASGEGLTRDVVRSGMRCRVDVSEDCEGKPPS